MKSVFHTILYLWSLIALGCQLAAQPMWPGDANNNGTVNGADFIYYGLAYGSTGPARPGASGNWSPQPIVPWATSFPNGVNFAFADFDGDGEVDNSDQSRFEANWGREHGIITPDGYGGSSGGAPARIDLVANATQVGPGAVLNIDVQLGSTAIPVSDVYGFAFKFKYKQQLVNNGGSDIDFNELPGSWLDFDDNTRKFFQKTTTVGRAEAGMTRTNQQPATGGGTIGSLYVVIEDIIVGLTRDTFSISIDSIVLYDNNLNAYAVRGDTVEVIVVSPALDAPSQQPMRPVMQIRPNPAVDDFLVELSEPMIAAQLFDMRGRAMPITPLPLLPLQYRFATKSLEPGLYVLHATMAKGTIATTVLVLPP
jgi:hypothetical protein